MESEKLLVIYPQKEGAGKERTRLDEVLAYALDGAPSEIVTDMGELGRPGVAPEAGGLPGGAPIGGGNRFLGRRVLFAVPLGKNGINRGYYEVLAWLRSGRVLQGSTAGMIIDAESELYTKAVARELAVAANQAGCALVGRPLVEGTASLDNFLVQAENRKTDRSGAYRQSARELALQVRGEKWIRKARPHLLVLHASNHKTSNTLAIWQEVKKNLDGRIEVTEINLRNGTLEDCSGCPYQMCLHFGERGQCFYGGTIVEDVYPAVREADGLLLLCPNYNDALSANMTAFINRLTALFRATRFYEKALFAVIVSGYSGSDLLAGQLITALNMNKTFYLPGNFCMMETANKAGAAMSLAGIHGRIAEFAERIGDTLINR